MAKPGAEILMATNEHISLYICIIGHAVMGTKI